MNKAEQFLIGKGVTKIYHGGSLRIADENGLGVGGLIADFILRGPTLWNNAGRALVLVDDPDKFMWNCEKRRYLIGGVKVSAFCHNDREGWNMSLEIGRRLNQIMNGRVSGLNRQLGLIVIGDLEKVRYADFDFQTNLAFMAMYSKEKQNVGNRGSLSVLAFDDTAVDRGDQMFNNLRRSFNNNITVSQEPIEE